MAAPAGSLDKLAPLAVLPPLAPNRSEHFTDAQWQMLIAIMDCVMPRIVVENSPEASSMSPRERLNTMFITEREYEERKKEMQERVQDPPSEEDWKKFLAERAVEVEGFEVGLGRQLIDFARKDQRDGLSVLLTALTYVHFLCLSSESNLLSAFPFARPSNSAPTVRSL